MKRWNSDSVLDSLKRFIKAHRQYRDYDVSWGVCKKVDNYGLGCRDLFRLNEGNKTIYVAKGFPNKIDKRNILDFALSLGKEWDIQYVDVRLDNQLNIILPKSE